MELLIDFVGQTFIAGVWLMARTRYRQSESGGMHIPFAIVTMAWVFGLAAAFVPLLIPDLRGGEGQDRLSLVSGSCAVVVLLWWGLLEVRAAIRKRRAMQ